MIRMLRSNKTALILPTDLADKVEPILGSAESNVMVISHGQHLGGYRFESAVILMAPYLLNTNKGLDWVGDMRCRMTDDSVMLHAWDDMLLPPRTNSWGK